MPSRRDPVKGCTVKVAWRKPLGQDQRKAPVKVQTTVGRVYNATGDQPKGWWKRLAEMQIPRSGHRRIQECPAGESPPALRKEKSPG